jgi:hypothetical protein
MPNNVINHVELVGTKKEVKKLIKFMKPVKKKISLFKRFKTYMYNAFIWGRDPNRYPCFFDFNNIVPMPPDIDNLLCDGYILSLEYSKQKSLTELLKELSKIKDQEKIVNLEKAFGNLCKYGYASWYDWSRANWGTKWNAYCQNFLDNTFIFETAWNGISDLIQRLSEKFPEIEINYKYSDEDTGYNTGIYKFKSGLIIEEIIPVGGSYEAYQLGFEMRPDYAKFYTLYMDNYIPKQDD